MTSVRQRDAALRYQREEQEAVVAKATTQLQQTAGALRKKQDDLVKQFWSRPASEIVSVTYDALGEGTDDGIDLPIGDGVLDKVKVVDAVKKFMKILNDKGFTLSRDGKSRLMTYVGYQFRAKNADPHNVACYVLGFDRLYRDLDNCFGDEVGWDASLVRELAPEPVSEPQPVEEDLTQIDLESIPMTGTREAEARARKVVNAQFESVIGPVVGRWVDSLKAEPWNVILTHEQWLVVVRKLERLFVENNLPIVPKSFDLARRVFTKDGTLPPGLLLEEEALIDSLEMTPLMNNRNARLQFVQESRKIRGL